MYYLVYYLLSFISLLAPSKIKPYLFSVIWFLFVGFRDGIGVDFYGTIAVIKRQIIDFNDISISFTGYNLFDAEIVYKIIGTFLDFNDIDINYALTVIALIEAIFIFLLIKKTKNKNLFIFFIIASFSLHYPMNAIRQGFCLIALIFANNYFENRKSTSSTFFYILSLLSHYASLPIVFLSRFKINLKTFLITSVIVILILNYLNFNTLLLRYSIDSIDAFTFKGYGLKLYFFSFLFIVFNYFVLKKSIITSENLYIILFLIITVNFNPFFRLFYFYIYYILFSSIFKLDYKNLNGSQKFLTVIIPFFFFLFEWQEIMRFKPCFDCGDWLPYKSLLF